MTVLRDAFEHWTAQRMIILLTVVATFFDRGMPLLCYSCASTRNDNCGPLFRPHGIEIVRNCTTVCALQRQKAIPKLRQVAGILRDCFHTDPTIASLGFDSSVGCRSWTNEQDSFTAYYCFCDTDLCNAASPPPTAPQISWLRRFDAQLFSASVGMMTLAAAAVAMVTAR